MYCYLYYPEEIKKKLINYQNYTNQIIKKKEQLIILKKYITFKLSIMKKLKII